MRHPEEQSVGTMFLRRCADTGYVVGRPTSLLQESIRTSFLFSVGFIDVMSVINGHSRELDRTAVVQRCFRHFDIDRVGDGRHLSFFHMAGALCTTCCRIEDQINLLHSFLTIDCDIPSDRLHVSYFSGAEDRTGAINCHQAAFDGWRSTRLKSDHIWAGTAKSNIWSEGANSGEERSGICGPHTEVFYDMGRCHHLSTETCNPFTCPERYLELANIVFISHRRKREGAGTLERLPTPLIELGVGVERLECVTQQRSSVFEIQPYVHLNSMLQPFIFRHRLHPKSQEATLVCLDHLRALPHLISDGARPGPKGRGHLIRKILKRVIAAAEVMGLDLLKALPTVVCAVADYDRATNSTLPDNVNTVVDVLGNELKRINTKKAHAAASR